MFYIVIKCNSAVWLRVLPSGDFGNQASELGRLSSRQRLHVRHRVRFRVRVRVRVMFR